MKGEMICVQTPTVLEPLNVCSILLTKTDKLLMGGRVIDRWGDTLSIKSDSGYGAPRQIASEQVFGIVTHLYLNGHLRPLYTTAFSRWSHRGIRILSRRILLKRNIPMASIEYIQQVGMRILLVITRGIQQLLRWYLKRQPSGTIGREAEQALHKKVLQMI